MQDNVKKNKNSLLRKTMTVFLLPSLIIIWMIGWVLVHSSSSRQIMKNNQELKTDEINLLINQKRDQEEPILA